MLGRRKCYARRPLDAGLRLVQVVAVAALVGASAGCAQMPPSIRGEEMPVSGTGITVPSPRALTDEEISSLPAATHGAVIPGLLPFSQVTSVPATGYALVRDAALYGSDWNRPVARFPALNFLGEPSVVVGVAEQDGYVLVLTPARRELPSARPAAATTPAAAQTAAWIAREDLTEPRPITTWIRVSVGEQTLTIFEGSSEQASFRIGVGAAQTPTPTNVTGYLQARYFDPDQGQVDHRIQLTSLHATEQDEPYAGQDGGLIGAHFQDVADGAVSHGCLRLDAEALAEVDALPLGTLVTIVP